MHLVANGLVPHRKAALGHVLSSTVVHLHFETCCLSETNHECTICKSVVWNLHRVNTRVVDLGRCVPAHLISCKMLWSLTRCETGDRLSALTGFGSDKRACVWAELPEVGVPSHQHWRAEVTLICLLRWRTSWRGIAFGATCSFIVVFSGDAAWNTHEVVCFFGAIIAICDDWSGLGEAEAKDDQEDMKNVKFHFVFELIYNFFYKIFF